MAHLETSSAVCCMWDSGSFESRSFEPGSWLFNLGQALRKLFNVMRVTVLTKVRRSVTSHGKRRVVIDQ